MNIVIPMAGRGSRLRPHTLTVPKPLVPVAGKPIVQRLVEDITKMCDEPVENIGFVIGDFGEQVEHDLQDIAAAAGAKGHIFHQDKPLGTAHAVGCAAPLLEGKTVIAFADTLFKANFQIDSSHDGLIYVHRVEDPSAFGVVKLDENGYITDFVEKPAEFVSDLAIIGIYFIKKGENLKHEIEQLIANNRLVKGEYQLTEALENLKSGGTKFVTGKVEEWLDCGNKNATVYTNQRILELKKDELAYPKKDAHQNAIIIPPCFIGDNVSLENVVLGPHVSVGHNSKISNAIIQNTIIQNDSLLENLVLENSMIGNNVKLTGKKEQWSLGDFSVID